MSRPVPIQLEVSGLSEHPALNAWMKFREDRVLPKSIYILKHQADGRDVFRLEGVGRKGDAVIAKRCQMATGLIERTIYEQILPHLPISKPYYYGFMEDDNEHCWLFLEDVGMERFLPSCKEHRALAGHWLGMMHSAAVRVAPAACLPDRGPNHYLEHLRTARQTILKNLSKPFLTIDDVAVLNAVISLCDLIESSWDQVVNFCESVPLTLVHGDFRPKNVHVRSDPSGTALFPMDWELAGWGVPAADLAPSRAQPSHYQVDLHTYCSIVEECWPGLSFSMVQQLVIVGTLFRRLAAIDWGSLDLACERPVKAIACLQIYQAELQETIRGFFI